jgi:hypothetical protein
MIRIIFQVVQENDTSSMRKQKNQDTLNNNNKMK